ncbi:hypothetical protein ACH79_14260 [Bradyrhizobium sp. CCBAU 051011]|nr:hypothetical protein ACH79_14260 [Bradyrhizobium sp. CCBAU 051011]
MDSKAMTMKQKIAGGKGTIPRERRKDLMRYDVDVFPLIPLYRPFQVRWVLKKGKWVKEAIGKHPLHTAWPVRNYNSRTVRAICIERGYNVGVRLTDELVVLDVDPRNGGDTSFVALCFDLGTDGDAFPRVYTGSGGWHCYMRKPADVLIRETLDAYPGLEFKSKGRQVVAAGSMHPNRKPYYWSPAHPDIKAGLPKIPGALLRAIKRTPLEGGGGEGGEWTLSQIAEALARLNPRRFNSNDKWLPLMQACHHASAGEARSEFIKWSVSDPDYADDAERIGKRWDSLHTERDGRVVTIRTLFKILRDNNASDLVPANAVTDEEFPDDM